MHTVCRGIAPVVCVRLCVASRARVCCAVCREQQNFVWGISLVHSRALTIRGVKFLVPFADMFNYSPHKVSWWS